MKNRELFQKDPATTKLMNDGVASVSEAVSQKERETLRFELEHFVCEGQYKNGFIRILESFLGSANSTVQPAAWVSGFYGSGKSHLLKMFRHLWVDTKFESDGATARGLAHLPTEISDYLKELDMLGKRCNGLHAASGTLPSGGGESVRLAVLNIVFRSLGLPPSFPQAQFCLWLKKNDFYDAVANEVAKAGKDMRTELHDLYVSPVLAKAILDVDTTFAQDIKQVRSLLREQYPVVKDISTAEFIHTMRDVLSVNRQIPCTVIVLDEIQLFIGDSPARSTDVQEVAEALCKQLDSRVLLIGSGQTALAGNVPLLQRLSGRFTIPVELSDTDVETVIRRVVLAKKADKQKAIEDIFVDYAGEIDRQLAGTRIGPRSDDRRYKVVDYPLLPVRRRFWERVLRAVDVPGTASQLRTQLRIVYEAVREMADKPLGTIMPADFIFEQLRPDLIRTGTLLREIDEIIQRLVDDSGEGKLAKRLCSLIFLIRKLPRDPIADIGLRATPEMLADLLVEDLEHDGISLRRDIPIILQKLLNEGKLIMLDDEYSLQTRESSEWDREFRTRQTRLNNDLPTLGSKRATMLYDECAKLLAVQKLLHGRSKQARKLSIYYGNETPEISGSEIPVWIRDGWGDNESVVLNDAREAGNDSPVVFVFIQRMHPEDLKRAIINYEAAKTTLEIKGTPSTETGREARDAMATRMKTAEATRNRIIHEIVNNAKVFQGGGNERFELDLIDKVRAAADAALVRMFPKFRDADHHQWYHVINRAKNGDESALQAVGWNDAVEKHPVCSAILSFISVGQYGKAVRDKFEDNPYGWPRDSIDGALMILFTSGHIRAVYKGSQLAIKELDQKNLSMSEFRVESATLNTRDRILLRKLFQQAGVRCNPNEESLKAGEFLARLADTANQAGGDPPLPRRPSIEHIERIRSIAGNEQLISILNLYETFEQQFKDWTDQAALATQRLSEWQILKSLEKHSLHLKEANPLQTQIDSIENERRLLEVTNPLLPIHGEMLSLLRTAVNEAFNRYKTVYQQEMKILTANEMWSNLQPDQQQSVLKDAGLAELPQLNIGDENELLQSLEETSLNTWKTRIQALPQQFVGAALAAAKLLAPDTRKIKLTSSTLQTPDDVKKWITKTEQDLLEQIKDGPVMIS